MTMTWRRSLVAHLSIAYLALFVLCASLASAEDILISWGTSDIHPVSYNTPKIAVRAYISTGSINDVALGANNGVTLLEDNKNISAWTSQDSFWPRTSLPGMIFNLADSWRIDTTDLNAALPYNIRAIGTTRATAFLLTDTGRVYVIGGVTDEDGNVEYAVRPLETSSVIAVNASVRAADTRFTSLECHSDVCVIKGPTGRIYATTPDELNFPNHWSSYPRSFHPEATESARVFYEIDLSEPNISSRSITNFKWSAQNAIVYLSTPTPSMWKITPWGWQSVSLGPIGSDSVNFLTMSDTYVAFLALPSRTLFTYNALSGSVSNVASATNFLRDMHEGVAYNIEPYFAEPGTAPQAAGASLDLVNLAVTPRALWMLMSDGKVYTTKSVSENFDDNADTTGSATPLSWDAEYVIPVWFDKDVPVIPATHAPTRLFIDPVSFTVYLLAKPTSAANQQVQVQQYDQPDLDWNDASLPASLFANNLTTLYTWGVPSTLLGRQSNNVNLDDWWVGNQRIPRSIQLDHLSPSLRNITKVAFGGSGVAHALTSNGNILTWGCTLEASGSNDCNFMHPVSPTSVDNFNYAVKMNVPFPIEADHFYNVTDKVNVSFIDVSSGPISASVLDSNGHIWSWGIRPSTMPQKKREFGYGRQYWGYSKATLWTAKNAVFTKVVATQIESNFDAASIGIMENGTALISGPWLDPDMQTALLFGGLSAVNVVPAGLGFMALVRNDTTGHVDLLVTTSSVSSFDCDVVSWGGIPIGIPQRRDGPTDTWALDQTPYCNLTGLLEFPASSIRKIVPATIGTMQKLLIVSDYGFHVVMSGFGSGFTVLPGPLPTGVTPPDVADMAFSGSTAREDGNSIFLTTNNGTVFTILEAWDITISRFSPASPEDPWTPIVLPPHIKVVGSPVSIGFPHVTAFLIQHHESSPSDNPSSMTSNTLPAGSKTTVSIGDNPTCTFGVVPCSYDPTDKPSTLPAHHPINSPTAEFVSVGRVGAVVDGRLTSGERRLIRWGSTFRVPDVLPLHSRVTLMEQPLYFNATALELGIVDEPIEPLEPLEPFGEVEVRSASVSAQSSTDAKPLIKMVTVGNTHIFIYENCTMDIQFNSEDGPGVFNTLEPARRSHGSTRKHASFSVAALFGKQKSIQQQRRTSSSVSSMSSFPYRFTSSVARSSSKRESLDNFPEAQTSGILGNYSFNVDELYYPTDHMPLEPLQFDYSTCPNEKVIDMQCAELEPYVQDMALAPIPFHCVILTDAGSLYTLLAGLNNDTCKTGVYGDRQSCVSTFFNRWNFAEGDMFFAAHPGLHKVDTASANSAASGQKVVQFKLGYDHVVALTDTNEIISWGSNDLGQLGLADSANTIGAGPVFWTGPPTLTDKKKSVENSDSASSTASRVVVRKNGSSFFKKSAQAVTYTLGTPTRVAINSLTGANFTKVVASGFASFALDGDSIVYGWGGNQFGELGRGAAQTPSALPWSNVPTRVNLPFRPIRDISCTLVACYALYEDGKVYSWGSNDHNLLGRSSLSSSTPSPSPIAPAPFSGTVPAPVSSVSSAISRAKAKLMAKVKGPFKRPQVDPTPAVADLIVVPNTNTSGSETNSTIPIIEFSATPASPIVVVSGNGSQPQMTPEDTSCHGPRPAESFRCIRSLWTSLDTLGQSGSVGTPTAPITFVVGGPTTIKGDFILGIGGAIVFDIDSLGANIYANYSDKPILNVTGCFNLAGGEIRWKITSKDVQKQFEGYVKAANSKAGKGGAEITSITSSCEMISSGSISYQTVSAPSSCKRGSAAARDTNFSNSQHGLQTVFNIDNSRCNKWWIILLTVIAAVLVIVLIAVLVHCLKKKKQIQSDSMRLRSVSSVRRTN